MVFSEGYRIFMEIWCCLWGQGVLFAMWADIQNVCVMCVLGIFRLDQKKSKSFSGAA
jgi:hypothetical protein